MLIFEKALLEDTFGKREVFNARRLWLTGDTEGLAAAQGMCALFQSECGIFMGCAVMPASRMAYFATSGELGVGEPDSPWIVAASETGEDPCLCRALERAAELGAFTVLVTCRPHSPAAKAVKRVLAVTPEGEDGAVPALCGGLAAVACRIADVKRCTAPGAFERWQSAWTEYRTQVRQALCRQEAGLRALAGSFANIRALEAIGDGACAGAARYAAGRLGGKRQLPSNVCDSEDWCHISFFVRDVQTVGTLFIVPSHAPSAPRFCESIAMAQRVGRTVGIVTDEGAAEWETIGGKTANGDAAAGDAADGNDANTAKATTLRLPQPPQGMPWLFVPFAMDAVRALEQRLLAEE